MMWTAGQRHIRQTGGDEDVRNFTKMTHCFDPPLCLTLVTWNSEDNAYGWHFFGFFCSSQCKHLNRSNFANLNVRVRGCRFCRCCDVCCDCAGDQEQVAEFEQERLELRNEISKLKEQNERLNSELGIRSQTVDKLKNKVRLPRLCDN